MPAHQAELGDVLPRGEGHGAGDGLGIGDGGDDDDDDDDNGGACGDGDAAVDDRAVEDEARDDPMLTCNNEQSAASQMTFNDEKLKPEKQSKFSHQGSSLSWGPGGDDDGCEPNGKCGYQTEVAGVHPGLNTRTDSNERCAGRNGGGGGGDCGCSAAVQHLKTVDGARHDGWQERAGPTITNTTDPSTRLVDEDKMMLEYKTISKRGSTENDDEDGVQNIVGAS